MSDLVDLKRLAEAALPHPFKGIDTTAQRMLAAYADAETILKLIDRLTEAAARIEALEASVTKRTELVKHHQQRAETMAGEVVSLCTRIEQLEAENTRLREALEPFALISSEGVVKRDTCGHVTITTCGSYFHNADDALAGKEPT